MKITKKNVLIFFINKKTKMKHRAYPCINQKYIKVNVKFILLILILYDKFILKINKGMEHKRNYHLIPADI